MKTLDLHGLTKDLALSKVDHFLYQLGKSGDKRARIMTGKGSGIIQKATIDYLKKAGFQWGYEKLSNGKENTGVLVIYND